CSSEAGIVRSSLTSRSEVGSLIGDHPGLHRDVVCLGRYFGEEFVVPDQRDGGRSDRGEEAVVVPAALAQAATFMIQRKGRQDDGVGGGQLSRFGCLARA